MDTQCNMIDRQLNTYPQRSLNMSKFQNPSTYQQGTHSNLYGGVHIYRQDKWYMLRPLILQFCQLRRKDTTCPHYFFDIYPRDRQDSCLSQSMFGIYPASTVCNSPQIHPSIYPANMQNMRTLYY